MYYNYVVAFAEREVDMGHEIPSRAHLTQNDNFTLLRGPVGGSLAVPILDWHFLRYLFISAKTGTAHVYLKDWVDGISIFMIFTL